MFFLNNWNNQQTVDQVLEFLKQDKIVLAQSDTILGLFGNLSSVAKKKLDNIKKRNLKPYIVLIQSVNSIANFTDQFLDAHMLEIMNRYWPGPLTILFKAKSNVPDWMIGSQGTIGLRVPNHEGLQKILDRVDGIFTTSANISDQPVPNSYAEIDPLILKQVDLIACPSDFVSDGPASTILDFSSGSIKIIRLGAVNVDSI